jgi:CHAT domain-containing protein
VILAISREHATVVPMEGRRAWLAALRRYRAALASPTTGAGLGEDALDDGRRVARAALGPVDALVASARRLYVVPDRELTLVPFAALPAVDHLRSTAGRRFLGDALEIAVLPLGAAPPPWEGPRAPVLLAGSPRLPPDDEFEELPWAAFELDALQRLWSGADATLLAGAALTRERLAAAADRFGTLHVATHAVASTRDPRRCGIVLSDGERLGLDEILSLRLAAPLVVLSACRTGEGELVPGEGVVGLGWAFLRAGARGIVVSRWTVDDAVSAKLMVAFHRRLHAGVEPVRALAEARREARTLEPHPGYWAAFDLVLSPTG